jgi:hypothetical protein
LPINNNVFLTEGVANTMVINNPKITTGDLTLEFWMKNSIEIRSKLLLLKSLV